MTRLLYLAFSVVSYAIFFATFLYLIAFVGNIYGPRTVDSGGGGNGDLASWLVNIALIALFGIQHSVMARQGFKAAWTRVVPKPIERSVYVLMASVALWVLFHFWQPIAGDIWRIQNPIGVAIAWALFGAGWLIVLLSTFLINHFELFGLQQTWLHMRKSEAAAPKFRTPFFYRLVRHPLYSGFFLAFWATPHMTAGHLLLALGMSVYMLIAIAYEERDLVGHFGEEYEEYRRTVGMLMPGVGKRG
jgi:methanethiol S-methyltransferase